MGSHCHFPLINNLLESVKVYHHSCHLSQEVYNCPCELTLSAILNNFWHKEVLLVHLQLHLIHLGNSNIKLTSSKNNFRQFDIDLDMQKQNFIQCQQAFVKTRMQIGNYLRLDPRYKHLFNIACYYKCGRWVLFPFLSVQIKYFKAISRSSRFPLYS